MIHFENVSKFYVQGEKSLNVLENLNFELNESGLIAIVGKSGSGKSTFLSLLAGLDDVSHGKIYIDGEEITKLSEESLTSFRAKNIGIVFQNFQLIDHFTTLENILLPLEVLGVESAYEMAIEVLNKVGLGERISHFPRQLSGGEKQRVAIARALVTNPKILLADEPSGNLDPETGASVMGLLFDMARELKQTVLLVTHDLELANQCDHIYEIKNHQIVKL